MCLSPKGDRDQCKGRPAERFAVGRRDDVQWLALQRQNLDAPPPVLVFAHVESPVTYGDAGGLIELPGR